MTDKTPPTMTGAHAELKEAGRAVREARALLADALSRHDKLNTRLNTAWREQEDLAASYQRLLLGVLRAFDDCTQLADEVDGAVVRTALLTLLDEQGVSPMPVAAGDRFDGERHSNQETVSDVDLPAGAVVEVLAKGYLRRAGKTTVVLRPAMVRVNAAKVK